MNKKRNDFRHGHRPLMIMFWLSLGLLECLGEETNRFPNSIPAEQFVWGPLTNRQVALTNQEFIDLANSSPWKNGANRTVRAQFLEWLLTAYGKQLPHQCLRLKNAVIEGPVDCHSLKVGDDLVMNDARFDAGANFIYAQSGHDFRLNDSSFQKSFDASGMNVGGSLIIDQARFGADARFDAVVRGQ